MKGRILSFLVIWTVFLALVLTLHNIGGFILLLVATISTQLEFYKLLQKMGYHPMSKLSTALGALMMAASFCFPGNGMDSLYVSVLVISLTVLLTRGTNRPFEGIASSLLGMCLIAYPFSYLCLVLAYFPDKWEGILLCIWLIAVAKFTDVGALLCGLAFGKHKMAPTLSPKKTWEGAIGGVLSSMLIAALFTWAIPGLPETLTVGMSALMAIPVSILAIFADLLESALKRQAGVKDSGAIFPGIGGAFDLTDSLMLTAPLGYYLFFHLL
jgi:phosphatidate cytidylyltransferase